MQCIYGMLETELFIENEKPSLLKKKSLRHFKRRNGSKRIKIWMASSVGINFSLHWSRRGLVSSTLAY